MNDPQLEGHMASHIGRRKFLATLGGAAAAWPLAARAQTPADRPHHIGILHAGSEAAQARSLQSFREGMRQLGYVEGHNIHYDYRFADGPPRASASNVIRGTTRSSIAAKQAPVVNTSLTALRDWARRTA